MQAAEAGISNRESACVYKGQVPSMARSMCNTDPFEMDKS